MKMSKKVIRCRDSKKDKRIDKKPSNGRRATTKASATRTRLKHGWMQAVQKSKQFLLLWRYQSCYWCYKCSNTFCESRIMWQVMHVANENRTELTTTTHQWSSVTHAFRNDLQSQETNMFIVHDQQVIYVHDASYKYVLH